MQETICLIKSDLCTMRSQHSPASRSLRRRKKHPPEEGQSHRISPLLRSNDKNYDATSDNSKSARCSQNEHKPQHSRCSISSSNLNLNRLSLVAVVALFHLISQLNFLSVLCQHLQQQQQQSSQQQQQQQQQSTPFQPYHNNIFVFEISENLPPNQFIGQLRANDGQIPIMIFASDKLPEKDLTNAIGYDPKSGNLTTVSSLDREQREYYQFTAIGSEPFVEVKVTVVVKDVNDNAPMFLLPNQSDTNYIIEFPEEWEVDNQAPLRRSLPLAIDADSELFGIKEFFIVSHNTPKGSFQLVEYGTPVDRTKQLRQFSSSSPSSDSNGNNHQSDKQSTSNANNNQQQLPGASPNILEQLSQQGLVPSSSHTASLSNHLISHQSHSQQAHYPSQHQQQQHYATINQHQLHHHQSQQQQHQAQMQNQQQQHLGSSSSSSSQGGPRKHQIELIALEPLDREKQSSYQLTIEAIDGGQPPLMGRLMVTINVIDINDNNPKFEQDLYEVKVSEDAIAGTQLIAVKAHDKDIGLNAQVSYSIARTNNNNPSQQQQQAHSDSSKSSNNNKNNKQQIITNNSTTIVSSGSGKINNINNKHQATLNGQQQRNAADCQSESQLFEIDSETGELRLACQLDFETKQEHELRIEARDHGQPATRSGFTTVRVIVLNVPDDDIPPVAQQSTNWQGQLSSADGLQMGKSGLASSNGFASNGLANGNNLQHHQQQHYNGQNQPHADSSRNSRDSNSDYPNDMPFSAGDTMQKWTNSVHIWFGQIQASVIFLVVFCMVIASGFLVCFVKTKSRQPESEYNDTAGLTMSPNGQSPSNNGSGGLAANGHSHQLNSPIKKSPNHSSSQGSGNSLATHLDPSGHHHFSHDHIGHHHQLPHLMSQHHQQQFVHDQARYDYPGIDNDYDQAGCVNGGDLSNPNSMHRQRHHSHPHDHDLQSHHMHRSHMPEVGGSFDRHPQASHHPHHLAHHLNHNHSLHHSHHMENVYHNSASASAVGIPVSGRGGPTLSTQHLLTSDQHPASHDNHHHHSQHQHHHQTNLTLTQHHLNHGHTLATSSSRQQQQQLHHSHDHHSPIHHHQSTMHVTDSSSHTVHMDANATLPASARIFQQQQQQQSSANNNNNNAQQSHLHQQNSTAATSSQANRHHLSSIHRLNSGANAASHTINTIHCLTTNAHNLLGSINNSAANGTSAGGIGAIISGLHGTNNMQQQQEAANLINNINSSQANKGGTINSLNTQQSGAAGSLHSPFLPLPNLPPPTTANSNSSSSNNNNNNGHNNNTDSGLNLMGNHDVVSLGAANSAQQQFQHQSQLANLMQPIPAAAAAAASQLPQTPTRVNNSNLNSNANTQRQQQQQHEQNLTFWSAPQFVGASIGLSAVAPAPTGNQLATAAPTSGSGAAKNLQPSGLGAAPTSCHQHHLQQQLQNCCKSGTLAAVAASQQCAHALQTTANTSAAPSTSNKNNIHHNHHSHQQQLLASPSSHHNQMLQQQHQYQNQHQLSKQQHHSSYQNLNQHHRQFEGAAAIAGSTCGCNGEPRHSPTPATAAANAIASNSLHQATGQTSTLVVAANAASAPTSTGVTAPNSGATTRPTTPTPALDRRFDLGVPSQLLITKDLFGAQSWDYLDDWKPEYNTIVDALKHSFSSFNINLNEFQRQHSTPATVSPTTTSANNQHLESSDPKANISTAAVITTADDDDDRDLDDNNNRADTR